MSIQFFILKLTVMQVINEALSGKLQEILSLHAEIELWESQYKALIKTDQPFEILKEARLKIKRLKIELKVKEEFAITSF
jgi:hypothetical protein